MKMTLTVIILLITFQAGVSQVRQTIVPDTLPPYPKVIHRLLQTRSSPKQFRSVAKNIFRKILPFLHLSE